MRALTRELVYQTMEREVFACLAFVTPSGEPRTAGVCYVVDGDKLYVATEPDSWKARYIGQRPHVALTIPIAKRIPFLPWIKIPAATISFHGAARILRFDEAGEGVRRRLMRVNAATEAELARCCLIEIAPRGHFSTYGVGTTLLEMRDHERAGRRVEVGAGG